QEISTQIEQAKAAAGAKGAGRQTRSQPPPGRPEQGHEQGRSRQDQQAQRQTGRVAQGTAGRAGRTGEGVAGVFDVVHRRDHVGRRQLQLPGRNHQLTGARFENAGQFLKASLSLPHGVFGAGVLRLFNGRKMLPRLVRQRIQLHRAFRELRAIERQAAAQHTADVFAGFEHLFEDRLALPQRRIGIDAPAGTQGKRADHQQADRFQRRASQRQFSQRNALRVHGDDCWKKWSPVSALALKNPSK
nr:hypothetical protein [Tanacetum cinerariifolium]